MQLPNIFITPKRKSIPIKQSLPISLFSQPLATTNLFSVSTHLPVLDISCNWNNTICDLLCLVSFTQPSFIKKKKILCDFYHALFCGSKTLFWMSIFILFVHLSAKCIYSSHILFDLYNNLIKQAVMTLLLLFHK